MHAGSTIDTGARRRLGVTTATLLVVANMIGTGVFTTTGFLVADLGSPTAVLAAWCVGALLALCGALAYGELGAALPHNGGEYLFLARAYHPLVGFVAGWISFVVGFSAPIAASALAFGHYLNASAGGVDPAAAAVILVLALSVLHSANVKLGGSVQNVLTVGKVALILVFVVIGIRGGDPARLIASTGDPFASVIASPAFAVGLVFVAFSYTGWNGAVYIAGELRNPGRTVPIALFTGTGIVAVLYLALNAVFLSAAPAEELAGVVEVGHVVAVHLMGESAGALLSGLIALALVSSVSAMIMAGPRVYEAAGRDHPLLAVLRWRTGGGGPAVAILLQAIVVVAMVLTASFSTLLTYIGFTLSLSSGLAVIGVFVLRMREPALHRPYRTWAYPVPPLLFVALAAWMIAHTLVERPVAALAGLATIGTGAGLYLLSARHEESRR